MAETRGWSDIVHRTLNRNLVMLLAGHLEDERIRFSDYHRVLRGRGDSLHHVTEVLATMGVLLDDRPDTFDAWLAGKLTDLSPAIHRDVERWARALRNGGPRVRRRDEATIRNYVRHAQTPLTDWSQRYGHLREVTRDDFLTALASRRGFARTGMLTALRSLFTWAKREGLIFRNPTTGIKNSPRERPILQPLTDDEISHAVTAATTPHARLFIALAAIYAARHGDIRAIRLDDVDLGNRRITIAGRARHIDDLTHQVLAGWLNYRRQRWPNTANPYLLISKESAVHHGPVSHPWVGLLLRGLPATIERLRIDRQLDEALACGADPLHLAAVFDIDNSTAIRYVTSARQLLQRPHEAQLPTSPGTRRSTPHNPPDKPSGSS
ncbi:tyrosine-type recombinase/integrase [Actinophytocola sp.]|uniref:tyrosine-type recombinase/integrase n=1 Tax=Actinophytocola sp. TaxID=1872138 RepID=UPI003D6A05B2